MRRILLLCSTLALPLLAGSLPEEQGSTAIKSPKPLEWRWSAEKASLEYCTKQHLADYVVERGNPKPFGTPINIRRKKDRKLVYTMGGGWQTILFTRCRDILYIAEYCTIASGCDVVAVDLKSGKKIWKTRLQGIGPTMHSQYLNLVNIETDGQIVTVTGNESDGRYIEHLDLETGKALANKKLDPE